MYTPLTKNMLPLENVILNAISYWKFKKKVISSLWFIAKEYFLQKKWDIIKFCPFCKNILLINILLGNPPPNNRPYSSGKGVVKIVQIWHCDDQPGIVRMRSFLVIGMILTIPLPIKSQICSIILRSGDWTGDWMTDMSCCSNHATVRRAVRAGLCHVETRMDYSCRQIYFLQNQDGFLTMFRHNCPLSGFRENNQIANTVVANHPIPLQKRFDFYWPCIDIRVYISPRLFSIPSPSRYNMRSWTFIHRRKVSWINCLVLSS